MYSIPYFCTQKSTGDFDFPIWLKNKIQLQYYFLNVFLLQQLFRVVINMVDYDTKFYQSIKENLIFWIIRIEEIT